MTQQVIVNKTDSFEDWRVKTNSLGTQVGELDSLNNPQPSIVQAINNLDSNVVALAVALG